MSQPALLTDGPSRRLPPGSFLVFGVIAAALAIVAIAVAVFAGQGRDDFDQTSVAVLTAALRNQGLEVCSQTAPDSGHGKGGSTSTQVLHVGLPNACGGAVDVQVDTYQNTSERDAAARSAEAQERQRNYGVVYTWHRSTVYLQADDASTRTKLRNRIISALASVGAQ